MHYIPIITIAADGHTCLDSSVYQRHFFVDKAGRIAYVMCAKGGRDVGCEARTPKVLKSRAAALKAAHRAIKQYPDRCRKGKARYYGNDHDRMHARCVLLPVYPTDSGIRVGSELKSRVIDGKPVDYA
jgi:hypothetical protein